MEHIKITNNEGLELRVTSKHLENSIGISGGDTSNPSWEEYLDSKKEMYHPHLLLMRESIKELGWIEHTAEQHANDVCFLFSDGLSFAFSWRGWGDFMQAIVNKNEGYQKYYMTI